MEKVKVNEIELIPVKFQEGLTFFANFILDEKYFLGNVAIYRLKDGSGFRLVYPTKKLTNGTQTPIFYPISKDIGQAIQDKVSLEAEKLLRESNHTLIGKYIFGKGERE